MEKVSHTTAAALLYAIKFYEWHLVSHKLANVEDEDTTVGLPLHQVAIRKQRQILINGKLFSAMDPANRVALVFHEAVYAVTTPIKQSGELVQPSYDVRRINRYLFKRGMTFEGLKETVKRFGEPEHEFLPVREQLGYVPDVTRTFKVGTYEEPGEGIVLGQSAVAYWWEKKTETTGSGLFSRTREKLIETFLLSSHNIKKVTRQEINEKCAYFMNHGQRLPKLAVVHYEHQIGFSPSVAAGGQTYLHWNMSDALGIEVRKTYKNIYTKEQCQAFLTSEFKKAGLIKD